MYEHSLFLQEKKDLSAWTLPAAATATTTKTKMPWPLMSTVTLTMKAIRYMYVYSIHHTRSACDMLHSISPPKWPPSRESHLTFTFFLEALMVFRFRNNKNRLVTNFVPLIFFQPVQRSDYKECEMCLRHDTHCYEKKQTKPNNIKNIHRRAHAHTH